MIPTDIVSPHGFAEGENDSSMTPGIVSTSSLASSLSTASTSTTASPHTSSTLISSPSTAGKAPAMMTTTCCLYKSAHLPIASSKTASCTPSSSSSSLFPATKSHGPAMLTGLVTTFSPSPCLVAHQTNESSAAPIASQPTMTPSSSSSSLFPTLANTKVAPSVFHEPTTNAPVQATANLTSTSSLFPRLHSTLPLSSLFADPHSSLDMPTAFMSDSRNARPRAKRVLDGLSPMHADPMSSLAQPYSVGASCGPARTRRRQCYTAPPMINDMELLHPIAPSIRSTFDNMHSPPFLLTQASQVSNWDGSSSECSSLLTNVSDMPNTPQSSLSRRLLSCSDDDNSTCAPSVAHTVRNSSIEEDGVIWDDGHERNLEDRSANSVARRGVKHKRRGRSGSPLPVAKRLRPRTWSMNI
eukprot:GEMP01053801.1.p1 GENE.GEMP01053801.1~~GEMP01053801.1.p1  ORF type:complete len:413 (+),score=91.87 GEMP01053801.1:195-1433(+)